MGIIKGGWVHTGWGVWVGLRLEQEKSVWLGFHSLPARVWAGTQLGWEHMLAGVSGMDTRVTSWHLVWPLLWSGPHCPHVGADTWTSLSLHFLVIGTLIQAEGMQCWPTPLHWKQPQAFLLSQVSGTVPCKSLFTYAIRRFYLVQCTVLQQPSNLHVLPDYLVIKPSKYKHTVIIV